MMKLMLGVYMIFGIIYGLTGNGWSHYAIAFLLTTYCILNVLHREVKKPWKK